MAESIELRDIWRATRKSWWLVAGCTLTVTVLATFIAFQLAPIYRAEVVMIPTDTEGLTTGGLGSMVEEFSGLAAVAGLTTSRVSQKDEALTLLRSRSFTREILQRYDLLKELFKEDWDAEKGNWRVLADKVPTLADGVERFDRRVRTISEDSRTGVVTLAIEWYDPDMAAKWGNLLVQEVNERLRQRVISEAQSSIDFLNAELEKTSIVELERAIFSIIEAQVNKIMIANVRPEYAFRVVDPAIPPDPDDYVRPQRPLIAALGLLLGAGLGVLIALFRFGGSRNS
jgi:uncharacterized protein involved in exopolysaccharide biosynthesis